MPRVREFRISVTVSDLDAALTLYRDVFGLQPIVGRDEENGRAVLELPRTTLELMDVDHSHSTDEKEVGRRMGHRVRFCVEVEDVVAAGREISDIGIEPISEPDKVQRGLATMRVKTPDGTHITLFQTST